MNDPRVAVVIPARDCAAKLPSCLTAVQAQTRAVDAVVISVGPSSDGTRRVADELAAADPRIVVCDNPAGDRGAGINAAMAHVTAEVVAMVDAQSILEPDYVESALEAMRTSGAGVVGGPMRPLGRTAVGQAVGAALASPFGIGDSQFHFEGAAGDVDSVYLGVYRSDVLAAVGPYSEVLLRTEDDDMNQRVREAGYRIRLDPSIRSTYLCRDSLGALWRQYHGYGYWKVALACARPSAIRWRHGVPGAFVAALVAAVLVSMRTWRPALPAMLSIYGAAGLLAGARGASLPIRSRLLFPLVTFAMHAGYGVGTLRGLLAVPRFRAMLRPAAPGGDLAAARARRATPPGTGSAVPAGPAR